MDWKTCLEDLKNTNKNAISVFLGAGMSVASGLPQWKELAEPYKQRMKIKDSDIPFERVFQYAFGSNRAEYVRFKNEICAANNKANPQPVHRLIARMNFSRIWTTNYDGLLEKAYKDENMSYQLVAKDEDIYRLDYERNQIIKMHGSLTDDCTTDIVLTESEYENYIQNRKAIYQLLQTEIRSKNIIYLGFSFNDINLRRIISAVWNQGAEGKVSYLFTVPPKKKSAAHILYERWKEDLGRYNLVVVEMEKYSEINDFMLKMVEMYFGKNIVLLGKRDDNKWNGLAQKIGYKLASKGFNIHSGGGPNIADSLATGAWDYLEKNKILIMDKVTFYYRYNGGSTNPKKGNVLYCGENRREVRRKMISADKICLVIGSDGIGENGIQEEISIANSKMCRIIPVGCSGDTAKNLWDIEKYKYQKGGVYSEKEVAFNMLNSLDASEEDIANAVVELADYLLGQKEDV